MVRDLQEPIKTRFYSKKLKIDSFQDSYLTGLFDWSGHSPMTSLLPPSSGKFLAGITRKPKVQRPKHRFHPKSRHSWPIVARLMSNHMYFSRQIHLWQCPLSRCLFRGRKTAKKFSRKIEMSPSNRNGAQYTKINITSRLGVPKNI